MMNRLVALAFLTMAAYGAEFRTSRISIGYDEQFRLRARWLAASGNNIVVDDPAAQPALEANGWTVQEFRLDPKSAAEKRIDHAEFGPSLEGTVSGGVRDERRGLQLEHRIRILLPDKLP